MKTKLPSIEISWIGHSRANGDPFNHQVERTIQDMKLSKKGVVSGGGEEHLSSYLYTGYTSKNTKQVVYSKCYQEGFRIDKIGNWVNNTLQGSWNIHNRMSGTYELAVDWRKMGAVFLKGWICCNGVKTPQSFYILNVNDPKEKSRKTEKKGQNSDELNLLDQRSKGLNFDVSLYSIGGNKTFGGFSLFGVLNLGRAEVRFVKYFHAGKRKEQFCGAVLKKGKNKWSIRGEYYQGGSENGSFEFDVDKDLVGFCGGNQAELGPLLVTNQGVGFDGNEVGERAVGFLGQV